MTIPAPIDGVIIERDANVGLNVDPAAKLFTVVNLVHGVAGGQRVRT